MRPPNALPAGLPAEFSVSDALRQGASPGRLRARDLVAPYPGVRARLARVESPRYEAAIIARARQYAPRLAGDQAFCGTTALALHGVELPARIERQPLHVNTPIRRARPQLEGVVPHRYQLSRVDLIDGIRVAAPTPSWVQAATVLHVDELIEVGDSLVRRQHPLCTIEQLWDAVERAAGRRGSKRLRAAVPWIRPGTDSSPETRTRLLIVRAGFPEPEVNASIYDGNGIFIARGDLVYREWKILIEHDGAYHYETVEQGRRDRDRLAALARAGWIVLHVHAGTLRNPSLFLSDVRTAISIRSR